jgi:hypothetical protein
MTVQAFHATQDDEVVAAWIESFGEAFQDSGATVK